MWRMTICQQCCQKHYRQDMESTTKESTSCSYPGYDFSQPSSQWCRSRSGGHSVHFAKQFWRCPMHRTLDAEAVKGLPSQVAIKAATCGQTKCPLRNERITWYVPDLERFYTKDELPCNLTIGARYYELLRHVTGMPPQTQWGKIMSQPHLIITSKSKANGD